VIELEANRLRLQLSQDRTMKNSLVNQVDGRQLACVVQKIKKFVMPALAAFALIAFVPGAGAQFVHLKSGQTRITVPVNTTDTVVVTNTVLLSGINSSGVALGISGMPPGTGATLSSGIVTANNTVVSITVSTTNLAEGVYTFSLSAAGMDTNGVTQTNNLFYILQSAVLWNGGTNVAVNGPSTFGDATQWLGGLAPGSNDDLIFSDLGGQSNSLIFNGTSTNLTPNIIIAASTTNASARFSQTNANKFYTIELNPGVTWSLTGSNGLSLLRDFIDSFSAITQGQTVTVFGSNATLSVSNEQANVALLIDNTIPFILDLSSLDNFVTDISQFNLGDYTGYPNFFNIDGNEVTPTPGSGGVPRQFLGSINYAKTNVIRAVFADPFHYTNADSRRYSLTLMNSELTGTSTTATLNFGISNLFMVDGVCLNGGNSRSVTQFNPALRITTNIVGGVTNLITNTMSAVFRGTNGGRMTMFCVGDGGGTNTANSNLKETVNFANVPGTSVDILTDQFILARDRKLIQSNSTPNYQGFITMANGIIDANTAILGFRQFTQTNTIPAAGSLGFCEGQVIVLSNGTFKVNGILTLGSTVATNDFEGASSSANTEFGQVIIQNGGTLIANQVNVGGPFFGESRNNFITISNNSTMVLSNTVASPLQELDKLTFVNSTNVMNLDGANPGPYIYVTNLSTTGNNTLKIASIKNLGSVTGPIQLISFSAGAGSFQNLIMPAGVGGALITTNNVGIFLTIITNTPKNVVWRGFNGQTWDLTSINWLDLNTGLQTNYANGDNVSFDDNAGVPTDVHLAGGLDIIPGSVGMTNNANAYIIDSQDGTAIKGSAILNKQGTNTVEIDATTSLNVQLNQGTLVGNGSGTIGSVVVPSGITMTYLGNIVGGITCAGTATINGSTSGGTMAVQSTGVLTNNGTFIGPFLLSSGALLVNSQGAVIGGSDVPSYTAVGNLVVPSGATFVNGGDIHAFTLTVNGQFEDKGTGTIFMNGDTVAGTRGLTIATGGVFIPGGDGIGTTSINDDSSHNSFPARLLLSTGSTNIFKIDPSAPANTLVLMKFMGWGPNESAPQINGGTLLISNTTGAPFTDGQSFTIAADIQGGFFSDASTNTTNAFPIVLPAAPGPGLAWDLSGIIHQGALGVRAVATTPTKFLVANFFTNVVVTNSSGNPTGTNREIISTLSWPTNYTGWELQQQSGALTNGLSLVGSNWTSVAGSSFVDSMVVTNILGTNGSAVFFRMIYP
jgi:hypothetical protein